MPAAAAILVVVAAFAAAVALAGNVLEGLGNVIRGMPFLLSVILLALVVAILVAIMYTVYMLLMQALLQAQAAAAAAGAAGTALWMGLITKILPGALLTVLFVPLLVISGIGGAVGACFLDPQCRSSATA